MLVILSMVDDLIIMMAIISMDHIIFVDHTIMDVHFVDTLTMKMDFKIIDILSG